MSSSFLTLSLLGYLKTRICWGGGNLTPPSKSNVWCPNMTMTIYIIGKLLCSTFRICKQICKNLIFYRKIQLYSKNVCKKKICPKNEKLYIFEKPLIMPIQLCKKLMSILNNLMCNKEKLKICIFRWTDFMQIVSKTFFYKNCAFRFFKS